MRTIADMAAEHERHRRAAERMYAEARACGCTAECKIDSILDGGNGMTRLLHQSPDFSIREFEYPMVLRHWSETTIFPAHVHEWLRSLHPVSDAVKSEEGTEPEVWRLMRGEE